MTFGIEAAKGWPGFLLNIGHCGAWCANLRESLPGGS